VSSEIVTVCLDGVDGRDYLDTMTTVLDRFGEEGSDDPRWMQSWRVSGGDDGLPLLDGHAMDTRVLIVDDLCAGAPRGLLDLDGARSTAAEASGRLWDAWQEFAAAYPKARSLEELYTDSAADPEGYNSLQAEAEYSAQPVVAAAPFFADGRARTMEPWSLESDPVGWFGLTRNEYAERRAARTLPTDGLLTREGEWLDPDQPRRGASSAEKMLNRFRDRLNYFAQADAYLRGLPAECFVVRVKVRL
jgi:hypothetical protein